MASLFPESNDAFSVPSTPEATTLSQAGDSDRNHTESHRDLGDAIVAIQRNVALNIHDHSGQPDRHGRVTNKLHWRNTHEGLDFNDPESVHHALGSGANQAARGNHTHTYNSLSGKLYDLKPLNSWPSGSDLIAGMMVSDWRTGRVWIRSSNSWILSSAGKTPFIRAHQTRAQAIPVGSPAYLEWGSNSDADGITQINSTTFRTEFAGRYRVSGMISVPARAPYSWLGLRVVLDGGRVGSGGPPREFDYDVRSVAHRNDFPFEAYLRLAANSDISIQVQHNWGGTLFSKSTDVGHSDQRSSNRLYIEYVGPMA